MPKPPFIVKDLIKDTETITRGLSQLGYVADEELATILFLMLRLGKPLLLEGHPGVGKTEVANVLAAYLNTDIIRLQCYEGLDVNSAVYEWNYQKQLLSIKIQEATDKTEAEKEAHIFGEEFLLKRPLLQSITQPKRAPVLLIDEIDRADEEFEAFLLELLSAFQISIPELGTIKAVHRPLVVLTSNRTRELSDALKRRCLYHWVHFPDEGKERRIVQKHLPDIEEQLLTRVIRAVQAIRQQKLEKTPGIAETLDWVQGLQALGFKELTEEAMAKSLGCLLKSAKDIERVKAEGLEALTEP
ncbi:MAG: MoxR family ATPase [Lewinellaceae bacterium]|nr:MoxR family ATPase [Phaeodactylibacter sp.]MCB0616341.1 MoxR family ATPase [Phaeodactylibacter sp.]MCB9350067.1 MoxR family ATPase [Lewinellaceae bacterium]